MHDGADLKGDGRNSTFIMVYEDVWQALLGDPEALAVYMALRRRTYDGNRTWYAKKKEMAEESGVSVATFERRIKVLQKHGLVSVRHQYRNPKTGKIGTAKVGDFKEQIQNIYTVTERTAAWYEEIANIATSPHADVGSPHADVGVTSQRGANIDPLHTSQTHTKERGASAPVADAPAPKKKSRKKPALPLPENWTPSERTVQAMAKECPTVDQEKELLAFRDHWWSKDERRASWDATYRNWIRRSAEWSSNKQSRSNVNSLADWGAPSTQQQAPAGQNPFRSIYDEMRAING